MALIEASAAPPKKSGSLVVTLAAVAGLSVVAAAGGWFIGTLLAPAKIAADKAAKKATEEAKPAEGGATGTGLFSEANGVVDMEPMTTNLSYPSDTWVRIEASLVFKDKPDTKLAVAIHDDFMAYLRTVSLQQISGPRGFQNMKADLQERARLRSKGAVTGVLFKTFVIE